MADQQSAKTKGYKRGLSGKSSSSMGWDDGWFDSTETFNARREG